MAAAEQTPVVWELPAVPRTVGTLRHGVAGFAADAGASEETVRDVALAVSEVVTNAVLHAYADAPGPGPVRVTCRCDGEAVVVQVADEGRGVSARDDSPGLGHGLATVGALVQRLDVTAGEDGRGTVVTMVFLAGGEPRAEAPGLAPLCDVALLTVADVATVDLVGDGVLRRAAAEVRGDAELTAWLRSSVPPVKPGTATWDSMRQGGARLVVHDPSVPRSPGGTGEHLDLQWWVAVALDDGAGEPAALWGLGGRSGGRPVPSPAVLAELSAAGGLDLTSAVERSALRARLALAAAA